MTRFVFASLFLVSSMSVALQVDNTKWVNEDKSHMVLQEDANGRLSGTYSTFVGCDADKKLPLIGVITGHVISFIVSFSGCNSTAVWNGVLGADAKNITAMWLLVTDSSEGGRWADTRTNQDIFIKQ